MVNQPQEYRWSSYHSNALGMASTLIKPHQEYLRLGGTEPERLSSYRGLFNAHLEPDTISQIRSATNGNYALGSERFQKEIEAALNRRVSRGAAGRPKDIAPDQGEQGVLL
jgi:putative transposase